MTKNHLRVAQGAASDSATVRYQKLLDVEILPRLERPGRYIGPFEASGFASDSAQTRRLALLWPSVPESHQTPAGPAPLKVALESRSQLPVELVCVPAPDAVALLAHRGLPAFSRPSWIPLPAFDRLLLWLEHPGQLPGLLTLLHLSGRPLRAADRASTDPRLIVAGPAVPALGELLSQWCDLVLPVVDPVELVDRLSDPAMSATASEPSHGDHGLSFEEILSPSSFPRGDGIDVVGDVPVGDSRIRPRLDNSPPTPLSRRSAGFAGARVTRIHLGAASEPLRQRLELLDTQRLQELCAEALGHESGQLELEFTLGLPGETAADRATIPTLVDQLVHIAPRGARQLKFRIGARLPGAAAGGISADLLDRSLAEIRDRLSGRKLKLETVAVSEHRVAAALVGASAEQAALVELVHARGAWHGDVDGSFHGARWHDLLSMEQDASTGEEELALTAPGEAAPHGLESMPPLPPTLDENGHSLRDAVDSREPRDRWRRWSALVPREYQLRLVFEKQGRVRHLSHRETADLLTESCRRAGLPLAVVGVVSPRPKLSFGPSLPVGVEGQHEFLDISLTRKAPGVVAALNEHLPEGLLVRRARYLPPGAKSAHAPVQRARYCVQIPAERAALLRTGILRFQQSDSRIIERSKGGVTTSMDLKSQITDLHTDEMGEDGVLLHFECDLSGEGSKLRPHEFVASLLECPMEDTSTLTLRREQLLSRGGEPLGPWKTPMELVEFAMRRSRQMVKRYS